MHHIDITCASHRYISIENLNSKLLMMPGRVGGTRRSAGQYFLCFGEGAAPKGSSSQRGLAQKLSTTTCVPARSPSRYASHITRESQQLRARFLRPLRIHAQSLSSVSHRISISIASGLSFSILCWMLTSHFSLPIRKVSHQGILKHGACGVS